MKIEFRCKFNYILYFVVIVLSLTIINFGLIIAQGVGPLVSLENSNLRFEIVPEQCMFRVLDKRTSVWFESSLKKKRFGEAIIWLNGKQSIIELTKCTSTKKGNLVQMFFDIPGIDKKLTVNIILKESSLELSYSTTDNVTVERITLSAFSVKNIDEGYFVVPVREGLIIPANSGKNFSHTFGTFTYEGCHMEMFGLVKRGSAVLITWHDPYVTLVVESDVSGAEQTISSTLTLSKTATSFVAHFIGKGDYVDIGKAYREIAKKKGWFINWDEKLRSNPQRSLLFGAANIKLWSLLSRQMSEDSSKEISKRVNWTFEEAAEVAEHIKDDLKIEKVLFTVGGWIHRGYDNQHPDILPAAPECGGDEKLRECSLRVQKLGYLFCLHDNYQDIYRDSPSWNEDYIMKTPDGQLVSGGHWAGGRAYLTCSQKALELAKRPQNLPAVKKLTEANAYFIDTTYAAGLYECFDPNHPLTRWDDMKWKQALSDYARSLFSVFGSECGREWAIPHADFFEGLTGVSGRHYHDTGLEDRLGGFVVPLFEIVYRDCIAMYGKYGYDPNTANEYVLDHIIYGRPLNYHSIPEGLYWKKEQAPDLNNIRIAPAGVQLTQVSESSFQIAYEWEVKEPPKSDLRVFVHFTDKTGKILFQNDHAPDLPISKWNPGRVVTGPFVVKVPEGVSLPVQVRVGMFRDLQGPRARLIGKDDGELRYVLGIIKKSGSQLVFEPAKIKGESSGVFVKADNGWAEGLHPMDRFIKNTCEVLNPLNEITARLPMTDHRFLSADKKIQRSIFGSGENPVVAVVNSEDVEFTYNSRYGGEVVLPKYGFLIESPTYIAFHAVSWNGIKYATPTLFTIRALDGKNISRSKRVRIFHGFGEEKLQLGSKLLDVKRELELTY